MKKKMAKFVSGPYDGHFFDHHQINAVGQPSQGVDNRVIILMPPLQDFDRIAQGEISKWATGGPLYPYERILMPNGTFEFHDASARDPYGEGKRA
jgi:hypothetical protein